MSDSSWMHVSYGIYQLCEIEVCDIFWDAWVGFNLVEQVATISQLHCYPHPCWILSAVVELDDISVQPNMFVQWYLHLQLFLLDSAIFLGVVLVYKLDGKDWIIGIQGRSFFDAESSCQSHRTLLSAHMRKGMFTRHMHQIRLSVKPVEKELAGVAVQAANALSRPSCSRL